jgi:hypothetical protein
MGVLLEDADPAVDPDAGFIARCARVLRERVIEPDPSLPDVRVQVRRLQGKPAARPDPNPDHDKYTCLNQLAGMIVGRVMGWPGRGERAAPEFRAQGLVSAIGQAALGLPDLGPGVEHPADARAEIARGFAWVDRLEVRVVECALRWGYL